MKPLSLAWIWLLFTGCIICSPVKQFASGVKSFDIPRVIDSIHQLYQNRGTYKCICSRSREAVIEEHDLKGYDHVGKNISQFLRRMGELRTLLLIKDVVEKDIENNIKDPFTFVMISIFTMKDVIDDLRPRIIEWKDQGISNIKEDIPFQWFNYHRFTKEPLKDVEIKDLEELLEDMYKEDIFSRRLLEFSGTILFLKVEYHPYSILPWLVTFFNNIKMMEIVENDIKDDDDSSPSDSIEIIDDLNKCRRKTHICGVLFGVYNRKEVYSLYMNIYSHACAEEKHVNQYYTVASGMLKEFESNPPYIKLKRNVEKRGAPLNTDIIPGFYFTRKLESDDSASEDKLPPADDSSIDAEQFLLNEEEELGFVGPDISSKAQRALIEKSHSLDYGRDTARLRHDGNISKNTS